MKYDPSFLSSYQQGNNEMQLEKNDTNDDTEIRCILCNEQTSQTQETHDCEFRTNANVNLTVLKIKSYEKPIR